MRQLDRQEESQRQKSPCHARFDPETYDTYGDDPHGPAKNVEAYWRRHGYYARFGFKPLTPFVSGLADGNEFRQSLPYAADNAGAAKMYKRADM